MTEDHKKALVLAGGIAVIAIVIYMIRQQAPLPPTTVAVNPSPTIGDLGGPPGYTTYNIPPVGSTGVDTFPVIGAPSINIVPGTFGGYSFGGNTIGGANTSIIGGASNVNLGGATVGGVGGISNATYNVPGSGGCCCDNTTVPGTINTGNAPTSIDQLLNWYGQTNPSLAKQMNNAVDGFTIQPNTISDLTTPLTPASNNNY